MLKTYLRSVRIWVVSTILTIAVYFAMLFVIAVFPFDRKRRHAHAQCFWWANALVHANPYWHITVKGVENIDKNKTYIMVANHQSLVDIIIVYLIRAQFKWVSKESLFKVPFVGWCLALARHIKLKRGEFGSIKAVYREAAQWLKEDISVLFFPEGTRSDTDDMGEFQNGAFKLAIKEKVSVLPISIKGTRNAIPKGSWIFTTEVPASITVLPAIDTSVYGAADFALLRDEARRAIESA